MRDGTDVEDGLRYNHSYYTHGRNRYTYILARGIQGLKNVSFSLKDTHVFLRKAYKQVDPYNCKC
jgi:hypothetical protein